MFFIYLSRLINNELFVKLSGLNVAGFLAAFASLETTKEVLSIALIIISILSQLAGIALVIIKLRREERDKEEE